MSKALVKIPKGTQCKNGICEQDLEVEVDLPEPKQVSITEMPQAKVSIPEIPKFENNFSEHQHKHESKDPHDELAKLMPKSVNYSKCPNGNCGEKLITNAKGITTKFKKCVNCNNNAVPKSSDYCPTCGISEPEEWDESELEIPSKEEEE